MKNILSIGFLSLILVLAACEMPAGTETGDSASSSTSASSVPSETTSSSISEPSSESSDSDTSSSDSSESSVSSSESSGTGTSESSAEATSSSEASATVSSEESSGSSASSPEASSTSSEENGSAPSSPSAKRTIDLSADNWMFSPSAITAKQGEVLELRITGVAGTHGFAVPELGINVTIAAGETVTVAIPTDAAGTFSFFCSVPCGTGHRDMTGMITIEA